MGLDELRQKIDQIDTGLLSLFLERMEAVGQVARFKFENSLPVLHPGREREILEKRAAQAPPAMRGYVTDFYTELMAVSREMQRELIGGSPVRLRKATIHDCGLIHGMQAEAFRPLLEKYGDYAINPGAESLEKTWERMESPSVDYYLILREYDPAGAVRVRLGTDDACHLSMIFVRRELQGRGYGRHALAQLEALYPDAGEWRLITIKEEAALRRFYERQGFSPSGIEEPVREDMTLIHYNKHK